LLEGDAGVGKTEVAKSLATALGRPLIRLQRYEGLDANAANCWRSRCGKATTSRPTRRRRTSSSATFRQIAPRWCPAPGTLI
jgi:hypothetical protein